MTGVIAALAVAAAFVMLLPVVGSAGAPSRAGWIIVVIAAVWGLGYAFQRAPVVPTVLAVLVGLALAHHVRRRRRRASAWKRRDAVIEACTSLVAELRSGRSPVVALRSISEDWPELTPVADAAVLDADVPVAWRNLAELPGAQTLRWVGAGWAVAHRSGAGLAGTVDAAVRAMEDDRAIGRVIEVELASARATAQLLAVLPLGVLLIGRGAGGDPFGFLLDSAPGWTCLALGLLLSWCGLGWIERIGGRSP